MNKKNIPTLVRFGTVGAGNTLVDFVVFFLLTVAPRPLPGRTVVFLFGRRGKQLYLESDMDVSSKRKSAWRGNRPVYHDQSCSSGRYICPSVHFSKSRPVPFYQQDVRNSRRNGHQLYRKQALGVSRTRHRFIKKTRSE